MSCLGGTWVVTTVTGPDMESGSVPEVVLVVCGCDGETEQIPLTPEGDTLSKEGPENTSKVVDGLYLTIVTLIMQK